MKNIEKSIMLLKENIKEQREINVELFKSIPMPSHEDPSNEKAEPILKLWRDGSNKLKNLIRELQELESTKIKSTDKVNTESKTFVNGFGEATKRNITCTSYRRAEKQMSKNVLAFMS